jgi:hypothetical protein
LIGPHHINFAVLSQILSALSNGIQPNVPKYDRYTNQTYEIYFELNIENLMMLLMKEQFFMAYLHWSTTLVPRDVPKLEHLTDSTAFAWEILRRRADYVPDFVAGCAIRTGGHGHIVTVTDTGLAATPFDLLFRRRPSPAGRISTNILAVVHRSRRNSGKRSAR